MRFGIIFTRLTSRDAGLTEPWSNHWTLPQSVGSAHNLRQPPVFLMADVSRQRLFLKIYWQEVAGRYLHIQDAVDTGSLRDERYDMNLW